MNRTTTFSKNWLESFRGLPLEEEMKYIGKARVRWKENKLHVRGVWFGDWPAINRTQAFRNGKIGQGLASEIRGKQQAISIPSYKHSIAPLSHPAHVHAYA